MLKKFQYSYIKFISFISEIIRKSLTTTAWKNYKNKIH